ncbi:MAG TPA: phospholipid scramblase-related protein [Bdellovibrionota bacterium]|nr:phospholipid scramblase-related protein [Bdellovibrionota bacterium]
MTIEQNQLDSRSGIELTSFPRLLVLQVHELGEWIGVETRNKYAILDEGKNQIGFAAEQQKGILGFLFRQFFGHWRSFEIHFFNRAKQRVMTARHPFRILFQRLEISDQSEKLIGAIQQRFSILTKRFDVENDRGMVIMEVASPIWKIWTFSFMHKGKQVACIQKKWTGIFSEAFTDKDNFMVEFSDPNLSNNERQLVLAASVFIDLRYFEKKAGR